jgi:hypothetical protein
MRTNSYNVRKKLFSLRILMHKYLLAFAIFLSTAVPLLSMEQQFPDQWDHREIQSEHARVCSLIEQYKTSPSREVEALIKLYNYDGELLGKLLDAEVSNIVTADTSFELALATNNIKRATELMPYANPNRIAKESAVRVLNAHYACLDQNSPCCFCHNTKDVCPTINTMKPDWIGIVNSPEGLNLVLSRIPLPEKNAEGFPYLYSFITHKKPITVIATLVNKIKASDGNINAVRTTKSEDGNDIHNQKTPLHLTIRDTFLPSATATQASNSQDIITLLLNEGSDPDIADAEGNTPLHALAQLSTKDLNIAQVNQVATMLLKFGANPNAQNNEGHTPLYYAKCTSLKAILQAQ